MKRALVLSGGSSHGAFQAGTLMALEEVGWFPDVVLGTSVGAINACGWASGLDGPALASLWLEITNRDVYKWRSFKDWLKFWDWNYVLETDPLRNFLEKHIDMTSLYEADTMVLASGIEIDSGRQCLFSSKIDKKASPLRSKYPVSPLTHEGIMASAAIPWVFPSINGVWDGAFQQHNPLKPLILLGVEEIVIVNVHKTEASYIPKGMLPTVYRIVELASSYHLTKDIKLLKERNLMESYRYIDVKVIEPYRNIPYSKMNFDDVHAKASAIRMGYDAALKTIGLR
jgi:NTE family protein